MRAAATCGSRPFPRSRSSCVEPTSVWCRRHRDRRRPVGTSSVAGDRTHRRRRQRHRAGVARKPRNVGSLLRPSGSGTGGRGAPPVAAAARALVTGDSLLTLVFWLLPVGFLPVLRPRWVLALVVAGLPVLLSQWSGTHLPWFHYGVPFMPLAIGGALAGLRSGRVSSTAAGALLAAGHSWRHPDRPALADRAGSVRLWRVLRPQPVAFERVVRERARWEPRRRLQPAPRSSNAPEYAYFFRSRSFHLRHLPRGPGAAPLAPRRRRGRVVVVPPVTEAPCGGSASNRSPVCAAASSSGGRQLKPRHRTSPADRRPRTTAGGFARGEPNPHDVVGLALSMETTPTESIPPLSRSAEKRRVRRPV